MKVLYWTEGFWPEIGGLEVLGTHLLRGLHERGHDFTIVTGSIPSTMPADDSYLGMPIHRFPFRRVLHNRDVRQIAAIRQALLRLKHELRPDPDPP